MRTRFLVVIAACLAACGPGPAEECRSFQAVTCERLAPCLEVSETECLRALDDELQCDDAIAREGDLEACLEDTRKLTCDDVDGSLDFAPSCDDVRFRR